MKKKQKCVCGACSAQALRTRAVHGVVLRETDTNHNTMNDYIKSLIRHALTGLAVAGALLASKNLIAPSDASAVNAAGASIGDALTVVITAVCSRLFITLSAKIFAGSSAKPVGGITPLVIGIAALGLFGGLVSCSSITTTAPSLNAQGQPVYDKSGKLLESTTVVKSTDSAAVNAYGGLALEAAKVAATYEIDKHSGK